MPNRSAATGGRITLEYLLGLPESPLYVSKQGFRACAAGTVLECCSWCSHDDATAFATETTWQFKAEGAHFLSRKEKEAMEGRKAGGASVGSDFHSELTQDEKTTHRQHKCST